MKRLLVLMLAVLVLAGCTGDPVQTTAGTETAATQEPTVGTSAPAPYDPASSVELQTGGAVLAYPLDQGCLDVALLGGELLVCYDTGVAYTMSITEQCWSDSAVIEDLTVLQTTESGVWYYVESSRTVVLLTLDLQTVRQIALPEEILGAPAVSNDMKTVFYCTEEGIRAMDTESGIARLLRQQRGFQGIEGTCFNGEMLLCRTEAGTAFIMAASGVQVDTDEGISYVDTYQERFFLLRDGGEGSEYLFGERNGDQKVFHAPEDGQTVVSALALGGVLTVLEQDGQATLEYYDLDSGLRTASVTLDNVSKVRSFVVDAANGCVWFLVDAEQYAETTLLCWTPGKSAVQDDTVFTSPRYTAASPDLTGLEDCKLRAQAISDAYGLDILVWTDGVRAPWTDAEPEYRVAPIQDSLVTLETLLVRFPEGMLRQIGTICDNGTITVSLVAELGSQPGQQAWVGGSAYIALEIGGDMESALYSTLYKVMDTYVLDNSSMLDEWGGTAPVEERADLFVKAMSQGMEEYFQTKSVQSDLKILCNAIRDAFGMKKYEGTLPWEQYLDQ